MEATDNNSTTTTKTRTVFKKCSIITTRNIRTKGFCELDSKLPCFSKIRMNGSNLYHNDVKDPIYQFTPNYSVKSLCESDGEKYMGHGSTFYVLNANYLYEFFIAKKDRKMKLHMLRSAFDDDGHIVDRTVNKIEYKLQPFILYTNGCVMISNKYYLRAIKYNTIDDSKDDFFVWTFYTDLDDSYNSKRTDDEKNATSIIYNLNNNEFTEHVGMINFNIVAERFVIIFDGNLFNLIDIKTGQNKMQVNPSKIEVNRKNRLKKIMNTYTVNSKRDIVVEEYTGDSTYVSTLYKPEEEEFKEPGPDECVVCSKPIKHEYVMIPCGHRQYCESCAKTMVSDKAKCECAGCGAAITNFVKIRD